MRIEMIVPTMEPGGQENVVAQLVRGLHRRGYDAGITCIERGGEIGETLRIEGHRVRIVPLPGIYTILRPRDLVSWFRALRPDVIHTHSGAWIKGARAGVRARAPRIVHTIHGLAETVPWHSPHLKRWASRYTAEIAAVSEPLREYLREVAHIRSTPIHVVPNGVDTERFRPGQPTGAIRDRFDLAPGTRVIGHVARLSPIKNQEMLIGAFAGVAAVRPDTFLVIAGDGPLRSRLEALSAELGVADHVGFTGLVADIAPLYRDFDIFTLPSLAEGTSISILEAMATGLPIVASAVGGSPQLLAHGQAGELVPSGDPAALADALIRMLDDSDLRDRLGRAARERAVRVYSEDAMLDRYEALYRGAPVTARALP